MNREELKSYIREKFIKNNRLINTTSKSYMNRNHKIAYEKIMEFTSYLEESSKFSERVYHILNDLTNNQTCEHPECNNILKFYTFKKGYRQSCSNKCGVYFNKKAKLETYGDENYNNPAKMIDTKIKNNSYTLMIETHKRTCLEKYGVKHHWLVPEINAKRIETFNLKYGVDYPTQNKEIRNKGKETSLERYGFENPAKNEEIKNKINTNNQKTCLLRYGVKNISQAGLDTNSGYKWKEYTLPSGKIIKYQGYEDKLLDELLLEYHEDEILTSRADMPEFWYIGLDGKNHRYFPDCYIPKTNTIYEVKSEWTLNSSFETNILKFNSVRYKGYNLKIMIY